jgi:TolC family type I secretion outer membrane protein
MVVLQRYLSALCLASLSAWCSANSAFLDEKPPALGLPLRWLNTLQLSVGDASATTNSQRFPASAPATANSPITATWPVLLAHAIHNAPSNRAAAAGLIAAQAQEKQAWINAWLPRVNAFASISKQQQTYNGQKSRTPSSSASLSATWPLWRAAERALVAAQTAATQQSSWREKLNQQQVALSVCTAYLDGVEANNLRHLTQAQLQILQEQLRINEKRMQGGMGTILDVLETRTRVEQAQSALQALDTRVHNQNLLIKRFSGLSVQWPNGLQTMNATAWTIPNVTPPLDQALQYLTDQNPQTQEARAQRAAAQATQRARQLEKWVPNIDMVGQASRSKQTARFDGQSESQQVAAQSVGVELSWPIFTSGFQQERVKEAGALLNQAQYQLEDTQSQTQTELLSAYQTLAQAQRVIAIEQQVVQTAQSGFDAVRKAFSAGIRNNVDVLNAQAQVYEAQQRLVSATTSTLLAQVNILALMGQLDGPSIGPLTSAFALTSDDNAKP